MPEKNLELIDLDVYGRNAAKGGGLEHKNDLAVSNGIIHFLGLARNDILYFPGKGGMVIEQIFKLISNRGLVAFHKKLVKSIEAEFGAIVTSINADVIPDFDSKLLEIYIYWVNVETQETNDLSLFLNMPSNLERLPNPENTGNKTTISYIGDNLVAFVVLELEKPEFENLKMILDTKIQKYTWGPYIFDSLTQTSSEFVEIDGLIGL